MCFLYRSISSRVVRRTYCLLITTIAIEGGTLLQLLSTGGRFCRSPHGLSGPVDSLLSWLLTGCGFRFDTVERFCLIFSFSTTAQREPRSPTTSLVVVDYSRLFLSVLPAHHQSVVSYVHPSFCRICLLYADQPSVPRDLPVIFLSFCVLTVSLCRMHYGLAYFLVFDVMVSRK